MLGIRFCSLHNSFNPILRWSRSKSRSDAANAIRAQAWNSSHSIWSLTQHPISTNENWLIFSLEWLLQHRRSVADQFLLNFWSFSPSIDSMTATSRPCHTYCQVSASGTIRRSIQHYVPLQLIPANNKHRRKGKFLILKRSVFSEYKKRKKTWYNI